MFLLVNQNKNVLVAKSAIAPQKVAFYLPELSQYVTLIVTQTSIKPAPAVQVHGSVGGQNYLNVFGEDPVQIGLSGLVAGSACSTLRDIHSALGLAVDVFRDLSVVSRAEPLRYRVGRSRMRNAFLVGMDINQDNTFADVAQFSMMLLGEPFTETQQSKPITDPNAPSDPSTQPDDQSSGDDSEPQQSEDLDVASSSQTLPTAAATVLLGNRGSRVTGVTQAPANINSNGEAVANTVVEVSANGYASNSQGRPQQ